MDVEQNGNMGLSHHNGGGEQQDEEASFKKNVEMLLLCPVCHETVTDPRQLGCGHFFCAECVDLLTVDDAVRCAKCSSNTPITDSGIRVHELADNLVKLLAAHGSSTKQQNLVVSDNKLAEDRRLNGLGDHGESDDDTTGSRDKLDTTVEAIEPTISGTATVQVAQNGNSGSDSTEVIIDPPHDYQSPVETEEDNDEPLPPPPPEVVVSEGSPIASEVEPQGGSREPVEHDTTDTHEQPTEGTSNPSPEDDQVDSRMKASEMKPSTVAMSIEMERQCGDCHSNNCTCNCNSTLLTPPVSTGSQLSVDTNTSSIPSDEWEPEISIKQLTRFVIPEAASHIEVANSNKIYATRWTYDENGSVCTFDRHGKKIKFIQSSHHNYSGITLSKLGFAFALNTSKHRVEEYSGVNGKKVRQFKLDLCRDPHAIDIMPTGEILVIDQERNSVIVYPNNKKIQTKPRCIKHELIKEPYDIATCDDGFYITSTAKRCLVKMDLDGNVIWTSGTSRENKKRLKTPQGVCVDDNGHVYVVDKANHNILVFTKDGEIKGRLSDKENGGQIKNPWYISVRDGLLAVLFSHNIVKTYQFA